MCCRYYFADETLHDLENLAAFTSENIYNLNFGEIRPTDPAPILFNQEGDLHAEVMRWGFAGLEKMLLINARAESALEKKNFSESVLRRRCIVPASHFFEWNKDMVKNTFRSPDHETLFMAGCYNLVDNAQHFVVLTTEANSSMAPVHDRMPLLLTRDEIEPWLYEPAETKALLKKVPFFLEREAEYEQLSLF